MFTEKHEAMQEHIEMLNAESKALHAHLTLSTSVVKNQEEIIHALEKALSKKMSLGVSSSN